MNAKSVITTQGFDCRSKVSRAMVIKKNSPEYAGRIYEYRDVDVAISAIFGYVNIAEHNEPQLHHRPYFEFRRGVVAQADIMGLDCLNSDICSLRFKKSDAPVIGFNWELENVEIQQAIAKGLMGFDYMIDKDADPAVFGSNYLRPVRDTMSIPKEFTENLWSQITVKGNVIVFTHKDEKTNRVIPLVSIELSSEPIKMTSKRAGYESIVNAIPKPMYKSLENSREKSVDSLFLSESTALDDIVSFDNYTESVAKNGTGLISTLNPDDFLDTSVKPVEESVEEQHEAGEVAAVKKRLSIDDVPSFGAETDEEKEQRHIAELSVVLKERLDEKMADKNADTAALIRDGVESSEDNQNNSDIENSIEEENDAFIPGVSVASDDVLNDLHLSQESRMEKQRKIDEANAKIRQLKLRYANTLNSQIDSINETEDNKKLDDLE